LKLVLNGKNELRFYIPFRFIHCETFSFGTIHNARMTTCAKCFEALTELRFTIQAFQELVAGSGEFDHIEYSTSKHATKDEN